MSIDEIKKLRRQLQEWKEYPLAQDCIEAIDALHSMAYHLLMALALVSTVAVAMLVVIILYFFAKAF